MLGVASSRETVRLEAFGTTNRVPVTPEHIFLLASITKPVVATAVMQLVADGLLLLNEPLERHLPELEAPGKPYLTAWHLLTHTSGVKEIDWLTTLRQLPERAVSFEVACTEMPMFAPGASFSYSTLTFHLLAELVARLSRRPFAAYLEARIFGPLGMHDTSFDPRRKGSAWLKLKASPSRAGFPPRRRRTPLFRLRCRGPVYGAPPGT